MAERAPVLRRVLLLLIGVGVLGLWVAGAAAVLIFLTWAWPSIVGTGVGLIGLVLVVATRPRVPGLGKEHRRVDPRAAPQLFSLLASIADRMNAPVPDVVAFDGSVNASTLRFGFRRRLAVVIGFPLWEALPPEERVALLAHEVAHEINGDLWRSPIIGNSIGVLARWHELTAPGSFEAASREGVAEMFGWVVMAVPHLLIGWIVRLQYRLSMDDHRQSEFAADQAAAGVGGGKALSALLERLLLGSSIDYAMRRVAKESSTERGDLWAAIRSRFHELPEDEKEAIRHAATLEEVAVDATHPPTHQRIVAVAALGSPPPLVVLDRAQNAAIDRELEQLRSDIEASTLSALRAAF